MVVSSIFVMISNRRKYLDAGISFSTERTRTPPLSLLGMSNWLRSEEDRLARSIMVIPRAGRMTLPFFSKCSIIFCTSFIGIANPIPSTAVWPFEEILLEVIPMTCP